MNLANKRFKNNLTGDIVSVLDSFENIVILDDKTRMDAKHLLNTILYTEVSSLNEGVDYSNIGYNTAIQDTVSPESFFNNQGAYNILADKIKSIPENMIKDDPNAGQVSIKAEDMSGEVNPVREQANNNESAVIMVSEEDERAELARKYGATDNNALKKQNEAFSKLLNDDPEEVTTVSIDRNKYEEPEVNYNTNVTQPVVQTIQVEDPIIKMFKGVKRNTNFNITLEINNKIPRADFIEMMEDSYETSLIEFLADEFTNNIISDPNFIRDMIVAKIKETVYGPPKVEEKPKVTKVIKSQDTPKKTPARRVTRKKEENI